LLSGVGEVNARPLKSFKRGYSSVGKNIFAIDTEHVKQMRQKNAAEAKRKQVRP